MEAARLDSERKTALGVQRGSEWSFLSFALGSALAAWALWVADNRVAMTAFLVMGAIWFALWLLVRLGK
jgi:hypothetical protein